MQNLKQTVVKRYVNHGSTFRKTPWNQLATKFSDLVTSKSISVKVEFCECSHC